MSRKQTTARRRAMMIAQVQAGGMTATEAAEALEIAPKTYHEWENRGLAAMMQGLTDREPGRPSTAPDPETRRLRREVERLRQQVMIMERTAELRAKVLLLKKLEEPINRPHGAVKKKGRTHGRNRAQRRRDQAGPPPGLGSSQPGGGDPIQAPAPMAHSDESEPAPADAPRPPETGASAAEPGAGSR